MVYAVNRFAHPCSPKNPERKVLLFQKIATIAIRTFIPLSLVLQQKDLILKVGAGLCLSLPLAYLIVKWKCTKPHPILPPHRITYSAPAAQIIFKIENLC